MDRHLSQSKDGEFSSEAAYLIITYLIISILVNPFPVRELAILLPYLHIRLCYLITVFPQTLLEKCSDLIPVYFIPLLLYQTSFKPFLYKNKVCSQLNCLSNGIKKVYHWKSSMYDMEGRKGDRRFLCVFYCNKLHEHLCL